MKRPNIAQIAKERGVQHAMHFTQLSNLPGIVEHGLLSRADLVRSGLDAVASDYARLDGEYEAISVSVSAVNFEMFEAKRMNCRPTRWVVLVLNPSVFWTLSCRFYRRNAATRDMKNHRGHLGGPWAFEQMFSDDAPPQWIYERRASGAGSAAPDQASYRTATEIPDQLPTFPDAEVQVLEPIPPAYILGAWVDDDVSAEIATAEFRRLDGPAAEVVVRPFLPRFANRYARWG